MRLDWQFCSSKVCPFSVWAQVIVRVANILSRDKLNINGAKRTTAVTGSVLSVANWRNTAMALSTTKASKSLATQLSHNILTSSLYATEENYVASYGVSSC